MTVQTVNSNRRPVHFSQWQCFVIYGLMLSPFVYSILLLQNNNLPFFHLLLFFIGWLTYTFLEYIAHRFWMHDKEEKHPGKSLERHMHHHRHPAELKITVALRNKLVAGNIILIAIAFILNNYFTVFAGLYTGFVYYCFIHFVLHKPIAKKLFPRLQASHIHHHCKFPDRCFSTCVTWWDRLFNTGVSGKIKIPERVIQFYFGKDGHSSAKQFHT